jgi:hypothetical protein
MNRIGIFVVAGLVFSGCELERSEGLGEGEIHMVVTDEGGDGVVGALVSVLGTGVGAISAEGGVAVVKNLHAGDFALRVSVDEDGDGVADLAAYRGDATIRVGKVRGLDRLTAFQLESPVVLAPTGSVSGTVAGCEDGEICRVVAYRHLNIGTVFSTVREVALPIEGQSGVQTDGTWRIDGLAVGEVSLVAFAATASASVEPRQQLIAASNPSRFGTATADVGSVDVAINVDTDVAASVEAIIEVAGDAADVDGKSGSAFVTVPSDITDLGAGLGGTIDGVSADARTFAVNVPVTVFDITVQLDGFSGVGSAFAATPNIGVLLPVNVARACALKLPEDDDPEETVYCDADNDGLLDADPAELDADGDGIPDADEVGCVGINVGTDADGDCLCDLVDPFPNCSSNDPADCVRAIDVDCTQ